MEQCRKRKQYTGKNSNISDGFYSFYSSRISFSTDTNDANKQFKKNSVFSNVKQSTKEDEEAPTNTIPIPLSHGIGKSWAIVISLVPFVRFFLYLEAINQEGTRLIVFGVAKIHKTRLLATLSGLKVFPIINKDNYCLLLQSPLAWSGDYDFKQ